MSNTITLTIEQMQAAMRHALGVAYGCLDVTTSDISDALDEAIEDLAEDVAYVLAHPCACHRGASCPFRGMPDANGDSGHCEECGTWLAESLSCPGCDATYVTDEDANV